MTNYTPPVDEMHFALTSLYNIQDFNDDCDNETVEAILEEAGKFAAQTLAPLNHSGDQEGCTLTDGNVKTASGFKDAYHAFCEAGWNAVPFNPEYGGQGLPWLLTFCVQEMWQAANLSYGLCPLLTQGAIDTIDHHGSDEQKATYLEKLISGEWTGTMNLTEPQAGSDLSAIKTKAARQGDGSYHISGQKIYITYGEHDFTDNIIHLVLARVEGAPEGVKGISLFIVPKMLDDGTRNDVTCTGIEHKLGIHASPTCTMQFGDNGGAIGFLVGEENKGLIYMFTMMNNARLAVGQQGIAVADRAIQAARIYASERVQGKPLVGEHDKVTIDHHEDVRRMFDTQESLVSMMRLLALDAAYHIDKKAKGDNDAQAVIDLLTPIVKGFSTDMAVHITSDALQIHGGMGFIEETGAAQYFRDARILPIYEGTNGIQANDFLFRKIVRDGGESLSHYIDRFRDVCPDTFIKDLNNTLDMILSAAKDNNLEGLGFAAKPLLLYFGYAFCTCMAYRILNTNPDNSLPERANAFIHHNTPHMQGYAAQLKNILNN